jgi:hypothetical protein
MIAVFVKIAKCSLNKPIVVASSAIVMSEESRNQTGTSNDYM